jgi:hypothetical protein
MYTAGINFVCGHIGDVMVRMLALSVVDRGCPVGSTKDY